MDNMREFHRAKQDIIDSLNSIIDNQGKERVTSQIKLLQPPILTCDHCFYCEPILNQCGVEVNEDTGECSNVKSRFYNVQVTREEDTCIYHSEVEAIKLTRFLTWKGFVPAPMGLTIGGIMCIYHYVNTKTGVHLMFDNINQVFARTVSGEEVVELDGLALADVVPKLAQHHYCPI